MEPAALPPADAGFSLDGKEFVGAAAVGATLAMTPAGRAASIAALYQLADLCDDPELEGQTITVTVDVGEVDSEKAEHYADLARTAGLAYTLRKFRGAPVGRLRSARPRERRGARARRRASSTTRDDGEPAGSEPPLRRLFIVDDHYLVVAVVL